MSMNIEIREFSSAKSPNEDNSRFEPIMEALKKALSDGKMVAVTFETELEAMKAQKWALQFGEYRSDSFSTKVKRRAGLCISSRSRHGNILNLWPKAFR